jgi:DNA polymerase (family X)
MASKSATNTEIAGVLDRIGDLLEAKGENPFRVNSYRRAATLVKDSDRSFAQLVREQGVLGLTNVRGIGDKLAGVIEEYVSTQKVSLLEELEKEAPASPPGEEKASISASRPTRRSGSASAGTKRAEPQSSRAKSPGGADAATSREPKGAPPVSVILDVDTEYRKKADEGSLKLIAPKQHNPEGAAWLPILSTSRGDLKFTAMFSNTALAHQLGKTDDWVVIYFKKRGEEERQCTVVTEHRGDLKGKRVIRGREAESQKYYR